MYIYNLNHLSFLKYTFLKAFILTMYSKTKTDTLHHDIYILKNNTMILLEEKKNQLVIKTKFKIQLLRQCNIYIFVEEDFNL